MPSNTLQVPTDWSSDGRWIFYQTSAAGVDSEIWLASVADHKTMPLLQTRFDNQSPALSASRDYLAFSANDTGRHEIYVQRFQGGDPPSLTGERRRVSRSGGNFPRWRRDGKELFFLSPDRHIMSARVRQAAEMDFDPPVPLFQLPTSFRSLAANIASGYEVSPDGQKFLVPIRKEASPPLQVVVNWQAELK
jgi:Tol biopolymer transport system component